MSDLQGRQEQFVEAHEARLYALMDAADDIRDAANDENMLEPTYGGWWEEGAGWQMTPVGNPWLEGRVEAVAINAVHLAYQRLGRTTPATTAELAIGNVSGFWQYDDRLGGGHEVSHVHIVTPDREDAEAVEISAMLLHTRDDMVLDQLMVVNADGTWAVEQHREPVPDRLRARLYYLDEHETDLAQNCLAAIIGDETAMSHAVASLEPRLSAPGWQDLHDVVQLRHAAVVAAHGLYVPNEPQPDSLRRTTRILWSFLDPA